MMKRHQLLIVIALFSLLMLTVFLTVGYSAVAAEEEETKAEGLPPSDTPQEKAPPVNNQAIKQAVVQALPNTPIDSIAPSPLPGLFEVVAGKNLFYTDPSGRYLVFGEIYDLKTARNITADRFQDIRSRWDPASNFLIPWEDLPMEAAVHYGYGEAGNLKLAIFSDPDCPYCRRLTLALQQVEGIDVSEIMFPVVSLHPEARNKAAAILCASDPAYTLGVAASGRPVNPPDSVECLESALAKVDKAVAFGKKNGINGTPALVAPDGRVHAGFMPPDKIKAWLKEK